MAKILVTGAGGTIGTALLKELELTNHEVVGVDKEQSEWELEAPIVQQNLCDETEIPSADVIIHLAAHSQVQPILDNPSLAVENIQMTERILDYARETDADVILASSREVYGSAIQPNEDDVSIGPTNPYGASKIGSEAIASSYAECFSVDVTILRFSNVYGPYELNARVVPIFIALGLRGDELTVYGNSKLLDFVYLDDVVDAIIQSVNKRASLSGEAITVGSGQGTQLSELAEMVVDHIENCPGYTIQPNRTGDTEKFVAPTEKANALLDLEPTLLESGLPETIEWYRRHEKALSKIYQEI